MARSFTACKIARFNAVQGWVLRWTVGSGLKQLDQEEIVKNSHKSICGSRDDVKPGCAAT